MPELQFKGKEFVYNHHLTVPYRPLVPDPEKSIGDASLNGNLIIHGDNLHALKALLPMYAGKVDCIFIDPPYNTGNEGWSYNDNVNSPMMKEWLSSNPINAEDMLRHDKWCAMMWPRLQLLKELLSDNGSFWMTIDDNEVHRARMLLDEIFGEQNFIASVCWQKKYAPANDKSDFSAVHDYVLCYANHRTMDPTGKFAALLNRSERTEEQDKAYKNPDNDPRGPWKSGDYKCNKSAEERPNLYYPITNPNTEIQAWPDRTSVWRYSEAKHAQNVRENRVYIGAKAETTKSPATNGSSQKFAGSSTVPGGPTRTLGTPTKLANASRRFSTTASAPSIHRNPLACSAASSKWRRPKTPSSSTPSPAQAPQPTPFWTQISEGGGGGG